MLSWIFIVITLKHQSTGRHVAPFGVRANQFLLFLFNETTNTNCVVLSLSRPGNKPTMPARYHNTMWLEWISHNLWVVIAIDIRPLYSMAYIMIKAEYKG